MAEKPKKKQSEKKRSSAATVESYRNKIVTFLKAYGKKSMPLKNQAERTSLQPFPNSVQKV